MPFRLNQREQIFVPIRRHLGNHKNIHVCDHLSVPRQPCIGMLAIHRRYDGSYIRTLAICQRMVHTSELRCSNMHSNELVRLNAPEFMPISFKSDLIFFQSSFFKSPGTDPQPTVQADTLHLIKSQNTAPPPTHTHTSQQSSPPTNVPTQTQLE